MKTVIKFLKEIEEGDNVIVICHNDADGICSAVLLNKYLKSKDIDTDFIVQPMPVDENLVGRLKSYFPKNIIIVDIAIDQQLSLIKNLNKMANVAVIDHHQIENDLNKIGVVHYNPRFEDKNVYQSASYCTYKICSKLMDMKKWLWVTGVGMVADYALGDSKDLVKKLSQKYGTEELYETILGTLTDIITYTKATRKVYLTKIIDIIDEMEKPEDIYEIKEGKKMVEAYEIVKQEITNIINEAKRDNKPDYLLHEMESDYNLRSPISTKLSEIFEGKFIGIYQKIGSKYKLSARNQSDDANVAKILKKATRGLKASAGGHKNAAGATIDEKNWQEFKSKLISILSK